MQFDWKKKGRIVSIDDFEQEWMHTHTQLPIPYCLDNGNMRIYFNSRTNGVTRPTFVDIDMNTGKLVYVNESPLLQPGRRGTFDDQGVMFSSVVCHERKMYMYYSGWNVPSNVRYHNSIGLAISEDGGKTFYKFSDGPILDRSVNIPIMAAGPYVIKKDNGWIMYFLSCSEWIEGKDKLEPVYDLHYALSDNGVDWRVPCDNVCIKGVNEAIAQPCVVEINNQFHMWYSCRKVDDYRKNKENSYRIGYAISDDGIIWHRHDECVGINVSDDGWDSEMIEYPYVVKHNNQLYMFYNGNGFGQSGFGYAVAEIASEEERVDDE